MKTITQATSVAVLGAIAVAVIKANEEEIKDSVAKYTEAARDVIRTGVVLATNKRH